MMNATLCKQKIWLRHDVSNNNPHTVFVSSRFPFTIDLIHNKESLTQATLMLLVGYC